MKSEYHVDFLITVSGRRIITANNEREALEKCRLNLPVSKTDILVSDNYPSIRKGADIVRSDVK